MMPPAPTTDDCITIQLPKIPDVRGNLTYIEGGMHIPFAVRRAYWMYDVPGGEVRGGHAYRTLQEFVIALSGSFDLVLTDGIRRRTVAMNRSYYGVFVPRLVWRQIANFSTNAVCLILASGDYDESDYLRRYDEYLAVRSGE
jgi:hypothetical protein